MKINEQDLTIGVRNELRKGNMNEGIWEIKDVKQIFLNNFIVIKSDEGP